MLVNKKNIIHVFHILALSTVEDEDGVVWRVAGRDNFMNGWSEEPGPGECATSPHDKTTSFNLKYYYLMFLEASPACLGFMLFKEKQNIEDLGELLV